MKTTKGVESGTGEKLNRVNFPSEACGLVCINRARGKDARRGFRNVLREVTNVPNKIYAKSNYLNTFKKSSLH
jgi:hypothetical protein